MALCEVTPAPTERLFTIEEAASIVGMRPEGLRLYLWRHPDVVKPQRVQVGRLRQWQLRLTMPDLTRIIADRGHS